MSRAYSGKIFDRAANTWVTRPELQDSVKAAEEDLVLWSQQSSEHFRALGANLEHDWRVVPDRVRPLWEAPRGPSGWNRFDERIEKIMRPLNFLEPANESNWALNVHPDTLLFNAHRMVTKQDFLIAVFNETGAALPKGASEEAVAAQVRILFPPGRASDIPPVDRQLDFLRVYFRRIGIRPYPVWVIPWEQMQNRFSDGADAWLAALGVTIDRGMFPPGDPSGDQLFFGLRYRKELRTLVRPSMLEVFRYPQHFPSPPSSCGCAAPRPTGGHPLGLTVPESSRPLLQEFVHMDFLRSAELVIGWGWASGEGMLSLGEARVTHHATRLSSRYANVQDWMQEPS